MQPAARRNEVLGWVRSGLRDFSISRAAVAWGIPIPRDPGQTVYVWFDALFGYASGAAPRQQPQLAFRGIWVPEAMIMLGVPDSILGCAVCQHTEHFGSSY